MPSETVFLKMPSAFPIAITLWPSWSLVASPSFEAGESGRFYLYDRDVVDRIAAQYLRREPAPVVQNDGVLRLRIADDVLVGENEAVRSTINPEPPPICTMPRLSTIESGICSFSPLGPLGMKG